MRFTACSQLRHWRVTVVVATSGQPQDVGSNSLYKWNARMNISPQFFITGAKAVLAGFALLALTACDGKAELTSGGTVLPDGTNASTDMAATMNIVETAISNGSFNTLVTALQATGLDTVLADESNTYTVFAPTDDAFTALGSETVNGLLADPEALKNILLYHVIPSAVDAEAAMSLAGGSVDAANNVALSISLQDGDLFINSSKVIIADVAASNGIIHVIDAVMVPAADGSGPATIDDGSSDGSETQGSESNLSNLVDTAVDAGSFNTLAAALVATGLDSVLADESTKYTVFAPTDAAFAELGEDTINALLGDPETLKSILLYHVIGGTEVDAQTAISLAGTKITAASNREFALSVNDGDLYVNLSKVTATDVAASNGVIHVIDKVLIAPEPVVASGSVVDVAVADGRFTTLVAALQATGLDTVLADHGGVFTVFAPTDEAFDKLGSETINALLGDLPTLKNILLTHVISGQTVDSVSAFAASGGTIETASGTEVTLSITEGGFFVNDSKVVIKDITAENGIIHVIDTVIQ